MTGLCLRIKINADLVVFEFLNNLCCQTSYHFLKSGDLYILFSDNLSYERSLNVLVKSAFAVSIHLKRF